MPPWAGVTSSAMFRRKKTPTQAKKLCGRVSRRLTSKGHADGQGNCPWAGIVLGLKTADLAEVTCPEHQRGRYIQIPVVENVLYLRPCLEIEPLRELDV